MSGVKRYDPVNSDGTCGICAEDADYGAYVEYADYARLEQECERLSDELNNMRISWGLMQSEREAALKQVERLRDLLTAWRRMFDAGIGYGDLGVLRGQTDAALSAKP